MDANTLYTNEMSKRLPYTELKLETKSSEEIQLTKDTSQTGFSFEVNLEYKKNC